MGWGPKGKGKIVVGPPPTIFYHTYLSVAVVGGVDEVVVDEGACNMLICVLHTTLRECRH